MMCGFGDVCFALVHFDRMEPFEDSNFATEIAFKQNRINYISLFLR